MSNPFEALYHLSRSLHQHETAGILPTVLNETGHYIGAHYGCVVTFTADDSVDTIYALRASTSIDAWASLYRRGLIGHVYHSQRTVNVRSLATDPRWIETPGLPSEGSAAGLPLYNDAGVCAVLLLVHEDVDHFDNARIAYLEEAASLTSLALRKAMAVESAHTDGRFRDAVIPIVLTDFEGRIVDINREACTFLSYDPADLIGQPITDVHKAGTDIYETGNLTALKEGEEIAFSTVAVTSYGDFITVVVRARRRRYHGQDVIELVEQDISAETELEHLRRDLSAMVYHDLRGPLQTIKSGMQKLGQLLVNHDDVAVLTILQTGIRSTRQLRRMIDSLLDIQRLEQGSRILNTRESEVRVLLGEAAQLVQPLAQDAGMRLKFAFEDDLPEVCMDEDMILRVVANLMENAIKYTPEGGTITLRAHVIEDEVYIGVRDDGPGIPTHMQEAIFDKFSRVKYQDAPKGIGLGLSFCKLAVEAHDGRIWVDSEAGEGSEFVFTLPVTREKLAVVVQ